MLRYVIRAADDNQSFWVIDTTTNTSVTTKPMSRKKASALREKLLFPTATSAKVPALRSSFVIE